MEIKQGDRIIIKNIPSDYQFKDLYITDGKNEGIIVSSIFENCNEIIRNPVIPFTTLYLPFKEGKRMDVSGSGHSINRENLKFVKRDKAKFWKWKDGIPKAHNSEIYEEEVNYFECEFKEIN